MERKQYLITTVIMFFFVIFLEFTYRHLNNLVFDLAQTVSNIEVTARKIHELKMEISRIFSLGIGFIIFSFLITYIICKKVK